MLKYIEFVFNKGLSAVTITSKLSSVSYIHKLANVTDPTTLPNAYGFKTFSSVNVGLIDKLSRLYISVLSGLAEFNRVGLAQFYFKICLNEIHIS